MNGSTDWGLIAAVVVGIGFAVLIIGVAVYEIGWGWRDFEAVIEKAPTMQDVPENERGPAAMAETEHQAQRYTVEAE